MIALSVGAMFVGAGLINMSPGPSKLGAAHAQMNPKVRQLIADLMGLRLGEALELEAITYTQFQGPPDVLESNRLSLIGQLLSDLGPKGYGIEIRTLTGTADQDLSSREARAKRRAETVQSIFLGNTATDDFFAFRVIYVDELAQKALPPAADGSRDTPTEPAEDREKLRAEALAEIENSKSNLAEIERRSGILIEGARESNESPDAGRLAQFDQVAGRIRARIAAAEERLAALDAPQAPAPAQKQIANPADLDTAKPNEAPAGEEPAADTPPAAPTEPRVIVRVVHLSLPDSDPVDWNLTFGAPDGAEQFAFGGSGPGRSFDLGENGLNEIVRGTVDLWFSPEWRRLAPHDPALFTLRGNDGAVRFAAHVLADRSGIALWDGTEEGYHAVPMSLTPVLGGFDQAKHLAIVTSGAATRVYLDGELQGMVPVGYNPDTDAEQLIVGAGPDGLDGFRGRIARLRFWNTSLDAGAVKQLSRPQPAVTPLTGPLRPNLVVATEPDPTSRVLTAHVLPTLSAPQPGWWGVAGSKELRIQNREAFLAGVEPPLFSQTQKAYAEEHARRTAGVDAGNKIDAILDAADAAFHPHFSQDALMRIKPVQGADLESLRPPPSMRSRHTVDYPWRADKNQAIAISDGVTGITHLGMSRCFFDDRFSRRWQCADLNREHRLETFDEDEYLIGVSYILTENRRMRWLEYYTNKRVSVPRGVRNYKPRPGDQRYTMFLPDGVAAVVVRIHFADASRTRPIGMELVPSVHVERPGFVLYSSTGRALRFGRWDETIFRPVSQDLTLYKALAEKPVEAPVLRVLGPGRLTLSGMADDLQLVESPPDVELSDTFNNTFVSLSKAVNLQANYMGYDLLQMDPLRLTDTGTTKPVFRMPAGDSKGYYDANRIFVPRGLTYRPEFTGKNNSTVHSSDTYAEFRDSFSTTVTAGVSGKLSPVSFSTSLRMAEARQSISENKVSKTMGMAKSVFYDLILDKSEIALADGFREDVARLAETRNFTGFIETYGTHYASAVVYGGIGVLEIDATERMRQTLRERGVGLKIETGVLLDAETQTKASFGVEHNKEHAETFRDVVGTQTESFYWIGGTHAGVEHNSWSVGTDGVVPVHVALRPIHELLSPLFFDDPDVFVRVRLELKRAIENREATASRSLPLDTGDPVWTLEARVDRIVCTDEGANSLVMPGQRDRARSPRQNLKKQFPMVFFRGTRDDFRYLRNFVDGYGAHDPDPDEENQPITVNCPSQENILPRSPYMTANLLARYRARLTDIDTGRAELHILDRRDFEHWVIYPPRHIPETQKRTDAFLAGLTLGVTVLVDELFTEDGSTLVA
ncbi:MAG: MAC/perforin domain-containing protein, partial [Pseudomonadota bacterium]